MLRLKDQTQKNVSLLCMLRSHCPTIRYLRARLSVYPHVPGLDQSPHYRFRVREVDSEEWESPFAFVTRCADRYEGRHGQAYWNGLIGGWTQTYCNFEMANHVDARGGNYAIGS
jgi:hypothetical protein